MSPSCPAQHQLPVLRVYHLSVAAGPRGAQTRTFRSQATTASKGLGRQGRRASRRVLVTRDSQVGNYTHQARARHTLLSASIELEISDSLTSLFFLPLHMYTIPKSIRPCVCTFDESDCAVAKLLEIADRNANGPGKCTILGLVSLLELPVEFLHHQRNRVYVYHPIIN